jgi:hypothetical protein
MIITRLFGHDFIRNQRLWPNLGPRAWRRLILGLFIFFGHLSGLFECPLHIINNIYIDIDIQINSACLEIYEFSEKIVYLTRQKHQMSRPCKNVPIDYLTSLMHNQIN